MQEKESIKFDILAQDSLNFDNYIEQSGLDIALYDESDFMSLRDFKKQMRKTKPFNRNNDRYEDRRSRYGEDRDDNYRDNKYSTDKYERRSSQRNREESKNSDGDLKFFLTNFPAEVTE